MVKVGDVFGRLTVILLGPTRGRCSCKCECGEVKEYSSSNLKCGNTRSCGCLRRERATTGSTTHGRTKTVEYQSWFSMVQRCTNPKHQYWERYGGRGIQVCERWKSFENFFADMGERPSKSHSLDRFPNIDGNYEPGNCRWATPKQQAVNKSTTVLLTLGGVTKAACEWADELGIPRPTVYDRVRKGWEVPRVLKKP